MTTITCKISAELNARLEALARRRRVSKSAILREALANTTRVTSKSVAPSAHDLVKHLCGSLRGPKNLSTNPKRLKGAAKHARGSLWSRMEDLVVHSDSLPADLSSNKAHLKNYGQHRRHGRAP